MPILENYHLKPVNIYGFTKVLFEQILELYDRKFGLKYISLRYFNAAWADPEGVLGEDHKPETHLIPSIMKTVLNKQGKVTIYGTNYQTPDVTCIRYYIHVTDLARAHILALKGLEQKNQSKIFNLGNESGVSVLEVVNLAKKIIGTDFEVFIGKRRAGDPMRLIASSKKIKRELGWKPKLSGLDTIIQTAWNWHKKHPKGYKD